MNTSEFFKALVLAKGVQEKAEQIPGAFVHQGVVKYTAEARNNLELIRDFSKEDQASFIKSLAFYEQTVGGIGSPTLLFRAFDLVDDPGHELFNWVLNNTTSYEYYALGAKSFTEIQKRQERKAARRAIATENLKREKQRVTEGKLRRAEKATINLTNAIKRGDSNAVEALLRQGAKTDTEIHEGHTATNFAESIGRSEIAQIIREWKHAP